MNPIEQQFFTDLEKKLWTAADKLRSSLDASVYKHVVLGLIFLKYVSDAFEERQNELRAQFQNPAHDYYMDPAEYGGAGTPEYEENIAAELEVRDSYTEKNVFWVPLEARWLKICSRKKGNRWMATCTARKQVTTLCSGFCAVSVAF